MAKKRHDIIEIDLYIDRHDTAEGRYYTVKNDPLINANEKLWSVTTILDRTASKSSLDNYKKKQMLVALLEEFAPEIPYAATLKSAYGKATGERPDYIKFTFDGNLGDVFTRIRNNSENDMKQKGEWGSLAHEIVAEYLQGKNIETKLQEQEQEVKTSVLNFQDWLSNEGKNIHWQPANIEKTVYHPVEKFAGTADAIGIEDDEYIVIDWKTGYAGTESKLQIAALAGAWNYHNPRAKITRGYVVQIPREKEQPYKIFPVNNLEEIYEGFLNAVKLFTTKRSIEGLDNE